MTMLTIRNIEPALKTQLRIVAARQGVSMEEQVRRILHKALFPKNKKKGFGSRLHQYFIKNGGVELELPTRSLPRQAPNFSDL
jgi:plasmid stability protein